MINGSNNPGCQERTLQEPTKRKKGINMESLLTDQAECACQTMFHSIVTSESA